MEQTIIEITLNANAPNHLLTVTKVMPRKVLCPMSLRASQFLERL
jgi:hypothetical protein